MFPFFCRRITTAIHSSRSVKHDPLPHCISWEFSNPRCPSEKMSPPSAVQTLVPLSGFILSVGWLVSLPSLSLCYSSDVDYDGHRCWQTSRAVLRAEIQTSCNYGVYKYYFSCRLGFTRCLCLMLYFRLPYNLMAWIYLCYIFFSELNRLIRKNFSHPHLSLTTHHICMQVWCRNKLDVVRYHFILLLTTQYESVR